MFFFFSSWLQWRIRSCKLWKQRGDYSEQHRLNRAALRLSTECEMSPWVSHKTSGEVEAVSVICAVMAYQMDSLRDHCPLSLCPGGGGGGGRLASQWETTPGWEMIGLITHAALTEPLRATSTRSLCVLYWLLSGDHCKIRFHDKLWLRHLQYLNM